VWPKLCSLIACLWIL